MRMRSPRMAPPVKGDVGSTATIPTLFPSRRRRAVSRSTSEDLPAPGGPVMPTTSALPACGKSAASSGREDGRPSSTRVIARATARVSPSRTPATSEATSAGAALNVPPAGAAAACAARRPARDSSKTWYTAGPGCADDWPGSLLSSLALVVVLAAWVLLGLPSRSAVAELAKKNPGKTRLMLQREAEATAKGRTPRTRRELGAPDPRLAPPDPRGALRRGPELLRPRGRRLGRDPEVAREGRREAPLRARRQHDHAAAREEPLLRDPQDDHAQAAGADRGALAGVGPHARHASSRCT